MDLVILSSCQIMRTSTELTPLSPSFLTRPERGSLVIFLNMMLTRPTYTADLQWNQVSDLEPPLGQCVHKGQYDFKEGNLFPAVASRSVEEQLLLQFGE
ncbi:hypothetical protein AVEN_247879-1 [Araneus ventricosus]|uniref:Uncharacterized protein n=1 Tax=Araneus ventricosus TaxID=182803 RepID=A0A4Y2MZP5_ARAVE|nr:hypothetical protein AVEN_247879-1 [Araneus ventricosus]